MIAGGDLDDLQRSLTKDGARRLAKSADRRANTAALVAACVARIETCVDAIRAERTGKL